MVRCPIDSYDVFLKVHERFRHSKKATAMAEEVVEEYKSSLNDLTFNSKVHINLLTMLAEDNVQYSEHIVKIIEAHLQKVSFFLFSR